MTTPTYDIPDAPGVPPINRDPGVAQDPPPTLDTSDGTTSQGQSPGPQWGIFDQDGNAVLTADSVFGVEFKKSRRISDYPVEKGGFASYNKVAVPYDFRITFTQGGSQSDRQTFLDAVDALVDSLKLYDCVTPEITYMNGNPTNYDYRRVAQNGASMLTVDIFMEEVRQTAVATFSNTKNPTSAGQTNDGTVSAGAPTGAQSAAVSDAAASPAGH